jgi:transcriptional regulator with GAF, ATPase, and Fis domain
MSDWPKDPGTPERVLSELSTRFTGLPAGEINGEMQRALRELVECFGTERATLFEFSTDGTALRPIHSWARPPIEPYTNQFFQVELPWFCGRLLRGEVVQFERLPDDLPAEAVREREYLLRFNQRSVLTIPIAVGGRYLCALSIGTFAEYRSWPETTVMQVRTAGQILAGAIYRQRAEEELRGQIAEIRRLQGRLEAENAYLREEAGRATGFDEIVGQGPAIRKVLAQVAQVAPTSTAVLLLGETGTGKELLARAIHAQSTRASRALVTVNCAALPAALIESELFGHEKGAFTGATTAKVGRFELAHEGTLLLDEIGELPVELQPKLLRVLQGGQFERLGSNRTQRVDVRIIAATNRDLARAIAAGRFREDLYYRLGVFPITIPPLRDRAEDIPLLVWATIDRCQARLGRRIERVPKAVMDALTSYAWPGNVRELENVIERAMILSNGASLRLEQAFAAAGHGARSERLDRVEREHIVRVLERCGWRIDGRGHAAEALGLHPNTLRSRMQKLGIKRPAR